MAFLLGLILGGVLLLLGWQWLFVINLPIAAVVIYLAWRYLPVSRGSRSKSFDWTGMICLSAALGSLAYGINRIDTDRFLPSLVSIGVWPFLAAPVLILAAFIRIERRAENPVVRMDLFRSRQMVLSYMLSAGRRVGRGQPGLCAGAGRCR